jgi:alpha-L-fucosidase
VNPILKVSLPFIGIIIILTSSCNSVAPPDPIGPLPSENQLNWHEMEYYAFVHFNMNTFTDMEWGTGGEPPSTFNPSQLDTRQWAKVVKDAGMKAIILTAKHHDGFCLWPTSTTEHSVKNSPWKNGEGDLVKDLAEACREFGLKLGLYLSPWDRNHPEYGRPEYVEVFHAQLRELLSNYGEVFEVWFDGANGGTGYYGGANEERKIDNKTYYEWEKVHKIVKELQPGAVIFGDGGPGVRWVGNEEGWANETNWSLIRKDEVYPGWPKYIQLRSGHEDGTHWVPAEADVSIRPGWYYHAREDHQVKSLDHLLGIYYKSVGRNASLLLNLPVDRRGLVHEEDIKQLMALRNQIDKDFKTDLALKQEIAVTNYRGKAKRFGAGNMIDSDPQTYWATDDSIIQSSVEFNFKEPLKVNRLLLQEYIPLGQRVKSFEIEAKENGKWRLIDRQTTIGYKRILKFSDVIAEAFRITFMESKGPLAISRISLFRAPPLLVEPTISRDKKGLVTLSIPDSNVQVFYTLNNLSPDQKDRRYTVPFHVDSPTFVKAVAFNPEDKNLSEVTTKFFDISKNNWKVIQVSSGDLEKAFAAIDDNPNSHWSTDQKEKLPQHLVIDLGKAETIKGITYTPNQDRWTHGIITNCRIALSNNGKSWKTIVEGEFSNIANSRTEKSLVFSPEKGRYLRFTVIKTHLDDSRASFGEVGVITTK